MRNRSLLPYLMISPVVILYIMFPVAGLINTVIESTGFIPALGLNHPGGGAYFAITGNPQFIRNLLFSLRIAAVSTIISTLLGVLIAYALATGRSFLLRHLSLRLLQTGMVLPYLYVVFLATIFLSRTGILSRLLFHFGFIKGFEDFPLLVFDRRGTGIVTAYVFKGTPFIALFTVNVMSKIGKRFGEVARTLSAGGFKILGKIYLPLCSGSIVWSSSILMVYTLGSFEVPYFLGVLSPESLSSAAFSLYITPELELLPQSMAMNVIILIISAAAVSVYSLLLSALLNNRFKPLHGRRGGTGRF